jgi:hypothetical protein
MGDKLNKLTRCIPGLTLSDIGWNGNRCTPHLRDQTEFLLGGKFAGQQIDFLG